MAENIIFENVIDKINLTSTNINSYFNKIDFYNVNIYDIVSKIPKYNLVIYIFIIFLIYNFITRLTIRLNDILFFLISTLLIYFLIKKDYTTFINYVDDKKIQLDFLHKLIFNKEFKYSSSLNTIITPIDLINISYLYLNPLIIDFYYNMRNAIIYNISAYIESVIHANNVIGLEYQFTIGINNTYLNYQVAIEEVKESLNNFNSMIYMMPSTIVNYNKFKDSIKILHKLLNQHIQKIGDILKSENKLKEINLFKMPDDFYDQYNIISPDNTKTKDYISIYDMY